MFENHRQGPVSHRSWAPGTEGQVPFRASESLTPMEPAAKATVLATSCQISAQGGFSLPESPRLRFCVMSPCLLLCSQDSGPRGPGKSSPGWGEGVESRGTSSHGSVVER